MIGKARDVRSISEYAYKRGDVSFVDFLDAVRAYNDTMQSYNDARAEVCAQSLWIGCRDRLDDAAGKGAAPMKVYFAIGLMLMGGLAGCTTPHSGQSGTGSAAAASTQPGHIRFPENSPQLTRMQSVRVETEKGP